jgi:hypothetical protein
MSTLFLALCVVVVVVERLVLITGPLSVMEREKKKTPKGQSRGNTVTARVKRRKKKKRPATISSSERPKPTCLHTVSLLSVPVGHFLIAFLFLRLVFSSFSFFG